MATCPVCELQFVPNPSRPAQQYCQRACTDRAKARRRRAPGVAARRAAREAARQAKSMQLPPTKTCAECGGQYAKGRYRYCSEPCSERARRRMDLVRYGKTPGEVDRCRKCGMSVPMKRKSCDSCLAVAVQNERQRARRRRKARQRGVVSEPYTLGEIAARDRHRCGICRKAVPMTGVVVPHPKAPTIDHVLPLAAGGHDVRANVQLAHFLCNSTKGAGGGFQQLALIG
jgi:hypothetical protein